MRVFAILLVIFLIPVYGVEKKKYTPEEFLKMDLDHIYPLVQDMQTSEVKELITKVRAQARGSYKEIDKYHVLISHLESVRAIEEESKRLKALHTVYILGFLLFGAFNVYLFIAHKKLMKQLENR